MTTRQVLEDGHYFDELDGGLGEDSDVLNAVGDTWVHRDTTHIKTGRVCNNYRPFQFLRCQVSNMLIALCQGALLWLLLSLTSRNL